MIRSESKPGHRRAARIAVPPLLLAVAVLFYGVLPSTARVQSEVEVQLQEEFAAAGERRDLRTHLRGAALRRAGVACMASAELDRAAVAAVDDPQTGPRLSLGLTRPLRC